MILLLELVRGSVVQAAVGAHGVVVVSPGFDDHTGFPARPEPLQGQAFVAELAVEALVGAVLPGLAGVAQRCADARLGDPFEDGVADELWAVIRAHEQGRAVLANQAREDLPSAV
jgi:hypothetical protein